MTKEPTKFTDAWHEADEREAEQTLKRKPLVEELLALAPFLEAHHHDASALREAAAALVAAENEIGRTKSLERIIELMDGGMTKDDAERAVGYPVRQPQAESALRDARQFIVDACSLIDTIKVEWTESGHWSEWDQSIRDRATVNIHAIDAALNPTEEPQP